MWAEHGTESTVHGKKSKFGAVEQSSREREREGEGTFCGQYTARRVPYTISTQLKRDKRRRRITIPRIIQNNIIK